MNELINSLVQCSNGDIEFEEVINNEEKKVMLLNLYNLISEFENEIKEININ